jgi:hypothetical protein
MVTADLLFRFFVCAFTVCLTLPQLTLSLRAQDGLRQSGCYRRICPVSGHEAQRRSEGIPPSFHTRRGCCSRHVSYLLSRFCHNLANAGVKFVLFLYCYSLRGKSSQVAVLWEDHRNDLFINGFGRLCKYCTMNLIASHTVSGILMSAGGSKLTWCQYPVSVSISFAR